MNLLRKIATIALIKDLLEFSFIPEKMKLVTLEIVEYHVNILQLAKKETIPLSNATCKISHVSAVYRTYIRIRMMAQ